MHGLQGRLEDCQLTLILLSSSGSGILRPYVSICLKREKTKIYGLISEQMTQLFNLNKRLKRLPRILHSNYIFIQVIKRKLIKNLKHEDRKAPFSL